jgi:isochorismate hydrolase
VRDALVLIDLLQRFDHEDGNALLDSLRRRLPGLRAALERARGEEVPVVYVNDLDGRWDSNAPALVDDALAGPGGDDLAELAPRESDRLLLKPRYSIFDHTPLVILLRESSRSSGCSSRARRRRCASSSPPSTRASSGSR